MECPRGLYGMRFHRPSKFRRTRGYASVFAPHSLTVSALMGGSALGLTGPAVTRLAS